MQTTGGEVIDGLTQMCTLHPTVLTYSTDLPMARNIETGLEGTNHYLIGFQTCPMGDKKYLVL